MIVGVGAAVHRDGLEGAVEPFDLMAQAVRRAAEDGAGALVDRAQLMIVPEGMWSYRDPAALVAERLGIEGARTELAAVGVLQQSLFDRASTAIARGDADVVVVVGGEARARARLAAKAGGDADETVQADEVHPDRRHEPDADILHDLELHRGLALPAAQYAVMESALRAIDGLSPGAHRAELADLWASFAQVAAANPWAWDRSAPSAEEILGERMVATPYTRMLCSQWNVDQAAAIVFADHDTARRAGIPADRWVYPHAGVVSNHMVPLIERPDLGHSHAIDEVGRGIEDVTGAEPAAATMHDLYSCFPAAVRMQARQLHIALSPAPTISGGMTFGGGPLNNAVLGALVRTVERLRDEGGTAYVSSISGMVTKYGAGVFGAEPASRPFTALDVADRVEAAIRRSPTTDEHAGAARVLGSTVVTGPMGRQAIVIAEAPSGERTVASTFEPEAVERFTDDDHVGREVALRGADLA